MLIKAEAETDPSYGKKPEEREIEELIERGIVNLDKPRGPSSHEVVAWIKRIMQLRKAGHGGTLDPKVSGVLPVTLEKSTKISHVLLPSDKEYVCVMRLHGDVSEDKILSVIEEFVGVIYQRPPLKSAVRRRLRRRRIYYIEDVEIRGRDVLMRIGCEAGTYMRKLCVDIGDVLGVGAHMAELRRTKTGVFSEEDSVTLQDLVDAYFFWKEDGEEKFLREMIKPVEFAVSGLPKVYIRDTAVDAICHGASLTAPGVVKLSPKIKEGDIVAIFTLKGELVALGKSLKSSKEIFEARRGLMIRNWKVLMEPGTYPRFWGT